MVELQNRVEGVEEKSDKLRGAEAQLEKLIASLQAEWAGHEKMIALDGTQRQLKKLPTGDSAAARTPPLRPRQYSPAGTGPATALGALLKWCGAGSAPGQLWLELRERARLIRKGQPDRHVGNCPSHPGSARSDSCCPGLYIVRGQPGSRAAARRRQPWPRP